MPKHILKYF